jgi:hypothetical protein
MLGLIRYITSPFSTPHSLTVLYTTLARPILEYACCLELHYIDGFVKTRKS